MDTRRLWRWLSSRDPVDVVLLPEGLGEPGHGAADPEGRAESSPPESPVQRRFGRRRMTTPQVVAVRVPAEAELEAADLLDLLTCAPRVDVVLSDDADGPAGPAALAEVVERASELAAMCGRAGDVGVVGRAHVAGIEPLDLDHVPVGRRALIGAPDRPLPEPAETPQRRLVDAVSALLAASGRTTAEPDDDAVPPTGSAQLRARGCCGDGLCVRVCPRDALRLEVVELEPAARPGPPGVGAPPRSQSQFRLVQVLADCDGCEACIEMCPNDALFRVGDHSWGDLLRQPERALRTGWVRECARCGASHRQMGDLCAVCTAQQQNPFAVRMPPGMG